MAQCSKLHLIKVAKFGMNEITRVNSPSPAMFNCLVDNIWISAPT